MVFRALAMAASLAILASAEAAAQSRWSASISGDAAFVTQRFAGADLGTGGGFGADLRFRLQPHLSAYAGWEWHQRRSTELVQGSEVDVNDNGYTLGLNFEHPVWHDVAGWVRAGALLAHVEVEDADGNILDDSGHGLGWEAGAGLSLPLAPRLRLAPGVRIRAIDHDLDLGGPRRDGRLSYVTMGVGLVFAF